MPENELLAQELGVSIRLAGDGTVTIFLGDSSISINQDQLSVIANAMLKAAVLAHNRSGKPLTNSVESEILVSHVVPTTVALGPSHLASHGSIVLRFGEAALGVAIPNRQLIALGQAIGALGASGPPQ